jgi:predicted nucleic acid-binding protein
MITVDTSVWINVLKDKEGNYVESFRERTKDELIAFTRFTQLELLQGAKNENEWQQLSTYLDTQYYIEASNNSWSEAARIYFELRRKGITIISPIDCLIAQIAIENNVLLLHCDTEFKKIARIRPLAQDQFKLKEK